MIANVRGVRQTWRRDLKRAEPAIPEWHLRSPGGASLDGATCQRRRLNHQLMTGPFRQPLPTAIAL
jgi:hypothetical protein